VIYIQIKKEEINLLYINKMTKKSNIKKLFLRILLSPIILLYGLFITFGGIIFPTTCIIMFSFFGLVSTPIIFLLKKSGCDLNYLEPIIEEYTDNIFIDHLLGFTILIWGALYITYKYIQTAKVII
jgi:hypothetical protein